MRPLGQDEAQECAFCRERGEGVVQLAERVTIFLAVCGIVWTAFATTERLVRKPTLKRLGARLYGGNLSDLAYSALMGLEEAFDRAFRVRKLGNVWLPGILRSVLISSAFIVALSIITTANHHFLLDWLRPALIESTGSEKFVEAAYTVEMMALGSWLLCGLLIGLAVDYVSLSKSRWIISRIVARAQGRHMLRWLAVDFALTAVLASAALVLVWYSASKLLVLLSGGKLTLGPSLSPDLVLGLLGGWLRDPLQLTKESVLLLSAYLTSLWVWLISIAVLLIGFIRNLEPVRGLILAHFDIEAKPLTVAGWLIIIIFGLLYWGSLLFITLMHVSS